MALAITFLLGLFFLVGVFIIKASNKEEMVEHLSIAMAFGAMVALAVLDLIPEVIESFEIGNCWVAVLFVALGVLFLKMLDGFIPEHNDGDDEEETEENLTHIGFISAFAIIIHNVVEGMTVYSMAFQSIQTGISLAIGVGLHNIPMGMLIYSTLKKEERSKKYWVLGGAVGSTFIGGLMMMYISPMLSERLISLLVCIALGMVIYILVFELYPSIKHAKDKKLASLGSAAGLVIVLLSMLLE